MFDLSFEHFDVFSVVGKSASLRTADAFPVVASLPPKNSVCDLELQNDFRDVISFLLYSTNEIE